MNPSVAAVVAVRVLVRATPSITALTIKHTLHQTQDATTLLESRSLLVYHVVVLLCSQLLCALWWHLALRRRLCCSDLTLLLGHNSVWWALHGTERHTPTSLLACAYLEWSTHDLGSFRIIEDDTSIPQAVNCSRAQLLYQGDEGQWARDAGV